MRRHRLFVICAIAVVHQSLSLVPTLTVADNIFLGSEARKAGVQLDRRAMVRESERLLDHYGIPLSPNQTVGNLTFAYRQLLEIAKALAADSRVLILDEPTSSLSKAEEPILFGAIREVTRRGIAVVYVSHRLSEIMDMTDRMTVLRDGANAGEYVTSETTIPALVEAIVGRPAAQLSAGLDERRTAPSVSTETVLEFDRVRAVGVNGASLILRRGEVLGLVGTAGSGRTELLETAFGLRRVKSGHLRVNGRPYSLRTPRDAIQLGIKLVPEDRHTWGLVSQHDIEHNIAMSNLRRFTHWHGLFRRTQSERTAEGLCEGLKVKAESIKTRVDRLSGGNQQKVVLGKWLVGDTNILLLDEPTAGVDVGARSDIYGIVQELADHGTAVLVSSSDYAELLQICTSFAFVSNGQISGTVSRSDVSDEAQLHRLLEDSRQGVSHDVQ